MTIINARKSHSSLHSTPLLSTRRHCPTQPTSHCQFSCLGLSLTHICFLLTCSVSLAHSFRFRCGCLPVKLVAASSACEKSQCSMKGPSQSQTPRAPSMRLSAGCILLQFIPLSLVVSTARQNDCLRIAWERLNWRVHVMCYRQYFSIR